LTILAACLLGYRYPKRTWRWALLMVAGKTAWPLFAAVFVMPTPYWPMILYVSALLSIFAVLASYLGQLLYKTSLRWK
jgi:hypothetical protein